jgi:hypothetical protein
VDWTFEPELGEVLREKVAAGDHKTGYDGSSRALSWDKRIFGEERKRDGSRSINGTFRMVETWHVGNLSWAVFRRCIGRKAPDSYADEALIRKYRDVVRGHAQSSLASLVHLRTEERVSVRRRRATASNSQCFSLESQVDCRELYAALEERGLELLSRLVKGTAEDPYISVRVIDNSKDGESAQLDVARVTRIRGREYLEGVPSQCYGSATRLVSIQEMHLDRQITC